MGGVWDFTKGGLSFQQEQAIALNTFVRHSHTNKLILDNTEASYTSAEKIKLGNLTDSFKGVFSNQASIVAAYPTPSSGWSAWNSATSTIWAVSNSAWINSGIASIGNMLQTVYDPQSIGKDSFSRANHTGSQLISTITNLGSASVDSSGSLSLPSNLTVTSKITSSSLVSSNLILGNASTSTHTLHIQGINNGVAGIYLSDAVPSSVSYSLYNDSGTLKWNGTAIGMGSSISGTTRYIGLFTASNAIGASGIYQDANNNIGIGTITPGAKLGVKVGTNQDFSVTSTNGVLNLQSVNDAWDIYKPLYIDGSTIAFNANGGGYVGIGTTNPLARLNINDGGSSSLLLGDNVTTGKSAFAISLSSATNGYTSLQAISAGGSSYGNIILNTLGGNVGIGTISPDAKLSVNGSISTMTSVAGIAGSQTLGDINLAVDTGDAGHRTRVFAFSNSSDLVAFGYMDTITESGGASSVVFGSGFGGAGDVLYINNKSGNVGIGTTSPPCSLTLGDSSCGTWDSNYRVIDLLGCGTILGSHNSTGWSGTGYGQTAWANNTYYNGTSKAIGTGAASSILQGTGQIEFQVAPSVSASATQTFISAMHINNSGYVGIGTNSPLQPLHVAWADQSHSRIRIQNTNSADGGRPFELVAGINTVSQSGFSIYDASALATRLVIDNNGRVGIGTISPTSPLQVIGVSVFADNAAATTGGLTAGAFYRTSTGQLMCVY